MRIYQSVEQTISLLQHIAREKKDSFDFVREVIYSPLELSGNEAEVLFKLLQQPAPQEFICSTGLCHYKAQQEPGAWLRRWAFDKEVPAKVKNAAGRWVWPTKFKLLPVTEKQCMEDDVPLYTSPPENKPWVGLTKAEKKEVLQKTAESIDAYHIVMTHWSLVADAIEAKLKEKNT